MLSCVEHSRIGSLLSSRKNKVMSKDFIDDRVEIVIYLAREVSSPGQEERAV